MHGALRSVARAWQHFAAVLIPAGFAANAPVRSHGNWTKVTVPKEGEIWKGTLYYNLKHNIGTRQDGLNAPDSEACGAICTNLTFTNFWRMP